MYHLVSTVSGVFLKEQLQINQCPPLPPCKLGKGTFWSFKEIFIAKSRDKKVRHDMHVQLLGKLKFKDS